MDAQEQVAALFCISAAYYGRSITDAVAQMYAHDLADLPVKVVADTLARLRRDPRRRVCPLPAEVREAALPPAVSQSPEQIAARVVGAVSRFGYPNASRARAYIGELGWKVVEDMGGWSDLCSRLRSDQIGTFTAQAREICRSYQAQGEDRPAAALPLGPGSGRVQGLLGQIGSW